MRRPRARTAGWGLGVSGGTVVGPSGVCVCVLKQSGRPLPSGASFTETHTAHARTLLVELNGEVALHGAVGLVPPPELRRAVILSFVFVFVFVLVAPDGRVRLLPRCIPTPTPTPTPIIDVDDRHSLLLPRPRAAAALLRAQLLGGPPDLPNALRGGQAKPPLRALWGWDRYDRVDRVRATRRN